MTEWARKQPLHKRHNHCPAQHLPTSCTALLTCLGHASTRKRTALILAPLNARATCSCERPSLAPYTFTATRRTNSSHPASCPQAALPLGHPSHLGIPERPRDLLHGERPALPDTITIRVPEASRLQEQARQAGRVHAGQRHLHVCAVTQPKAADLQQKQMRAACSLSGYSAFLFCLPCCCTKAAHKPRQHVNTVIPHRCHSTKIPPSNLRHDPFVSG